MTKPTFSIIAPVFNEAETLPLLYPRVRDVMEKTGEPWELVVVDDGSLDDSPEIMRSLAEQDPRVRPVIFARNFGHQLAVTAGLDYARGDAVEAAWAFVEPILHKWKDENFPLHGYPCGTWGPEQADQLIENENQTWRYPCKNLADDGEYCEL